MTVIYNDYEIMEAAFRGTTPAAIRAGTSVNAYSSQPSSGTLPGSPTSTPTHINNSYFISELSMKIKGNARISLFEVMQTMEIYEDIFSKSIHGHIEIKDIDGGLSKYMITGGENIRITILKPLPSSEIIIDRSDLIIYNISKVEVGENNTMLYKLYFMPAGAISAQKKRIFKVFRNNTSISSLINTIYSDVSGGLTLFTRANNLPALQKNFLSPGYTPYEAIDFLSKRSCYNGDYFLFFERLNKLNNGNHVFSSINNLKDHWTENGPTPVILYQPIVSNITPENATAILASYMQIQDNFDHINNMNAGFYNSRIRMLDLIYRNYTDLFLNYSTIQNELRTNNLMETTNVFLNYNSAYPEYPGERLMVRSYNDVFANKNTWVRTDVYGSLNLSNMRINIDIPGGNNLIGAGNIVDLKIPNTYAKSLNLEGSLVPDDIVYAGKYIVTAVRHIFNISSYIKKLELSRDSGRINLGNVINRFSNVPPPSVEPYDIFSVSGSPPPPSPPPAPAPPAVAPAPPYEWAPVTCFPAGSMVLMADGTEKAIETIIESDILMGADGQPVTIKVLDFPILGERKMLSFAEDRTMRWSDEHLFWGKNETKQWWWTADHSSWIKEVEMGAVVGLKDNNSFLPTEGFQFANMEGFVNRTVIDVSHEYPEGRNTKLYLPVNNTGVPFIVNGYVVTGGTNEFTYDYTQFDWSKSRNEVISKVKRG